MDSVTQMLFGGGVAALTAPPAARRKALLLGGALGTLPDLDVLVPYADPAIAFTSHRGFSHSLLVLPFIALAVWALMRIAWPVVREAPWRWLLAIELALVTHPLLDAMTVYGTQLLWPLERPPVMLGNLFIIDPLFTLPLVVGVVAAWRLRERPRAGFWLTMGLLLGGGYTGWTLYARHHLDSAVRADLPRHGLEGARVLVVPTPFNSVLWRILVVRADGLQYFEGFYSFANGRATPLDGFVSTPQLLVPIRDAPAVERLTWFTRGFYKVEREGDRAVFTDLRMGVEPTYTFRFVVGEIADGTTRALEPTEQLPWPSFRVAQLKQAWERTAR